MEDRTCSFWIGCVFKQDKNKTIKKIKLTGNNKLLCLKNKDKKTINILLQLGSIHGTQELLCSPQPFLTLPAIIVAHHLLNDVINYERD